MHSISQGSVWVVYFYFSHWDIPLYNYTASSNTCLTYSLIYSIEYYCLVLRRWWTVLDAGNTVLYGTRYFTYQITYIVLNIQWKDGHKNALWKDDYEILVYNFNSSNTGVRLGVKLPMKQYSAESVLILWSRKGLKA